MVELARFLLLFTINSAILCIIAKFTVLEILYIIAKLVELAIFGGIYLFIYYPSALSLILDSNLIRLARLIIIFLLLFLMFL